MADLSEYLKNVKEKVRVGLGDDAKLAGSVVLELSTITEARVGGGININIVELGSQVKAQEIQKITIPFGFNTELDKEKEKADIEEQKARAKLAESTTKFSDAIAVRRIKG